MARYRGPTPANWALPRLANALTPDANGATLDSQSLLTTPIVEVSPGRFQFTVNGGVAKLDPKDGAVLVLPWRDRNGQVTSTLPMGLHVRCTVHTAPAGSSGVVIAYGMAVDAALVSAFGAGIDWDGADPRARCYDELGVFSTSTSSAAGVGGAWTAALRPGPTNTTNYIDFGTCAGNLVNSDGSRVLQVARTLNKSVLDSEAPTYLFVSLFGSGVIAGPITVEFSINYFYAPLPEGERL